MSKKIEEQVSELKIDSDVTQKVYEKVRLEEITSKHKYIKSFGWIKSFRGLKKISFLELYSAFKTIKAVAPNLDHLNLTVNTSVSFQGEIVENKTDDGFDFELQITSIEKYNNISAPVFPINKESDHSTWLEYGHLALRTRKRTLFLQARSALKKIFLDFYYENGYCNIDPPLIVQNMVEGGSDLFELDYFGQNAYLTQSSQLYLETVAPVAGKAFCMTDSFRAEKSKTRRHLTEYLHVEAEIVDVTMIELMDSVESLIKYAIKNFYSQFLAKIKAFKPEFEPIKIEDTPFKRIRYNDAIEFLKEAKVLKYDGTPYEQMDDISDSAERYLVEHFGKNQPVFLTHFPIEHKPFYMKRDGIYTQSFDVLFPGIGEIVGGSMRCDDVEQLKRGFNQQGIEDLTAYQFYMDLSIHGPSPHGGYGLGFERILMGLMKYDDVTEATLYPRRVNRCSP